VRPKYCWALKRRALHYRDSSVLEEGGLNKFYLHYPVGVSTPIRVYYKGFSKSQDTSLPVHYCLNRREAEEREQKSLLDIVKAAEPPTIYQESSAEAEALKETLQDWTKAGKWPKIGDWEGSKYISHLVHYRRVCLIEGVACLEYLSDDRPWPKSLTTFKKGEPTNLDTKGFPRESTQGGCSLQDQFDSRILQYIEHRLLDWFQALDLLEIKPKAPFWIDLWDKQILDFAELKVEDNHPRARGIKQWKRKRAKQQADLDHQIRSIKRQHLIWEENSDEEFI
jgi:hypothetical protein